LRLLCVAVLLAACSGGPVAAVPSSTPLEQVLRVNLAAAPVSLDPARVQYPQERAVLRQLGEPLLRPLPGLSGVEGAAAERYEVSADRLTYTFHLRAARYRDGLPVRAADFVYAWRRLLDPRVASPSADLFAASVRGGEEVASLDPAKDGPRIDSLLRSAGLAAPDERTFQVTLPQAEGWFPWVASLPEGVPVRQDVIDRNGAGWAKSPDTLVLNGPFVVTAITGERIDLQPNPDYWGPRPRLKRLSFISQPNLADAAQAYDRGQLEMTPVPRGVDATSETRKQPELTVYWVHFNATRPPFDSPSARLAFARAVDRKALVAAALQGRAQEATSLIPEGMPGYRAEAGRPQEFDARAANALLDASGGRPASLRMLVPDSAGNRAVAGFLQARYQDVLGVPVSLDFADQISFDKRVRQGDFDLAGPFGWTADYPDWQTFFDRFRSTDGWDLSRWASPQYDNLVRQADAEGDPGRREQLYLQAQQLIVREAAVGFLFQRTHWTQVKPYVRGLKSTAFDDAPLVGDLFAPAIYIASH